MLTDLRKRLDAVGRLDILDSVGQRALAYYGAQDTARLDPDALGRRARSQLLVGEIDNSRGDLVSALAAYEAAAATTGEQLRRAPDNPQRMFDHSQSVFWVGSSPGKPATPQGRGAAGCCTASYAGDLVGDGSHQSRLAARTGLRPSNLGSLLLRKATRPPRAMRSPNAGDPLQSFKQTPDDTSLFSKLPTRWHGGLTRCVRSATSPARSRNATTESALLRDLLAHEPNSANAAMRSAVSLRERGAARFYQR